jgi:hypothetical protein
MHPRPNKIGQVTKNPNLLTLMPTSSRKGASGISLKIARRLTTCGYLRPCGTSALSNTFFLIRTVNNLKLSTAFVQRLEQHDMTESVG